MSTQGIVHQISISDGGVPKLAVDMADIGRRGVVGDRQADRQHHGSPDQALCLYSLEVIKALQAEGHPIAPGSAGENITISGLDWTHMRPGTRLRIGATVIAEVTWPASPCSKNAGWFVDRNFVRMSQDQHPGWSRWYARVIEDGRVATGDVVGVAADEA